MELGCGSFVEMTHSVNDVIEVLRLLSMLYETVIRFEKFGGLVVCVIFS